MNLHDVTTSGKSVNNCDECAAVSNKFEIDGHKMLHCFACNRCSVPSFDLEHRLYIDVLESLPHNFDALALGVLSTAGSFTWLCHSCRDKVRHLNNPVDDSKLDVANKPGWFKELTDVLDAKFEEIDNKVNSNIDVLAADLNNFKENVKEKLTSFSHAAKDPATDSPLRKRKVPFPARP